MGKWYDKGFEEALASLPSDPPMHPKHRSYSDYVDGYADGERQLAQDIEREEAEANPRCEDCGEQLDAKERELRAKVCLDCSIETFDAILRGEY